MQDLGVGLVGYGLGGRVFHAPFVQYTDGLELRSVVSAKPAKVHADLPEVSVVPAIEQLLADDAIDLVIVSSPDELHARHAIAALQAGKHVVLDKPFATNLADARRVADAADQAKRLLTVFHNRRWDADFLTLQRLLAEGTLGRIVHFESHFDRWRPEVSDIWKEAREGGSWFDLGPHLVDQTLRLFGMPLAITADLAALRDDAPAPDWFHAILHYRDMRATLHSSKLSADHRLRFAVHGTAASWIKHGMDNQEPAIAGGRRPGDEGLGLDAESGILTTRVPRQATRIVPNELGDYGIFWRSLVLALRGSGPNPVPVAEALDVMAILQAGIESNRNGSTVRLDSAPRQR